MSHTSLYRSQDSTLCTVMGPQCPDRLWDSPSIQAQMRRLFHVLSTGSQRRKRAAYR